MNLISIEDDRSAPTENARAALHDLLLGSETPMLLLASGGSALRLLDQPFEKPTCAHITIATLDERFSREPRVNNFQQIKKTQLYKDIKRAGCHDISTVPKRSETLAKFADRINKAYKSWMTEHPLGMIVATQGIGKDGHTAGILPFRNKRRFETLFHDPDRAVVGYRSEGEREFPKRITVTIPFLTQCVAISFLYIMGREKRDALEKVLENDEEFYKIPGRVISHMRNVQLFTDIELY